MATLRADNFSVQGDGRGSATQRDSIFVGQDAGNFRAHGTQEAPHERHQRRNFVLCFDGTGNKFSGTDADSNILKIYRILDRDDPTQFHYYQPGIGTYVQSSSLSHSSKYERIKSTYLKAKDQAIGTSFDEHVMGGYKFLMRYYNVGDDIYLFGFSRGAYTARFLAEMLDHVGLLSAGNEEMARFAWKAFQRWQQRTETTEKEKQQKKFLMNYMCAFRETFSRPVRRIRFLGLFDTVNSVPQFENAWLQRTKFPYTARSTAKVIRHAASLDERRAKFRQDLIGEVRPHKKQNHYRRRHLKWDFKNDGEDVAPDEVAGRGRRPSKALIEQHNHLSAVPPRFSDQSEMAGVRSLSPAMFREDLDQQSVMTDLSQDSMHLLNHRHGIFNDQDSDDDEQDIQEVWFAGAHADIGGGWPLAPGEDTALSHIPLVWMVREAEKAGLRFDPKKVRDLNCAEDVFRTRRKSTIIPHIAVDKPTQAMSIETTDYAGVHDDAISPLLGTRGAATGSKDPPVNGQSTSKVTFTSQKESDFPTKGEEERASRFVRSLEAAAKQGRIHDALQFNTGSSAISVIAWNFMEYLPFRRMDLQPDGSWKSINWPLPKGEIPDDVVIHHSVIQRMKADPTYRPGNLIVGGGGRGIRFAPAEYGIGKWRLLRDEGDPIGECWVRDGPPGKLTNGANRIKRRRSFRDKSILIDELMRDLEDILKLAMNILSLIIDFVSRRLARQDKM